MNFTIRNANQDDIVPYTAMLQQVYEATYTNTSLGLTADCFSMEVFQTKNSQDFLIQQLQNNETHRSLLAVVDGLIVGSLMISDDVSECSLHGFYVRVDHQGKGIGTALWKLAREYAGKKDITLDIYTHNVRTIDIYKKWGFIEHPERSRFFRHWPEWPDELEAESMHMLRQASS